MILVDTGVMLFALGRRTHGIHPWQLELRRLLDAGETLLIPAIVMQEVLAGARNQENYERLSQELLEKVTIRAASIEEHRLAARIVYECRAAGVTTGAVDALIAAQAIAEGIPLATADSDYHRIALVWPRLKLHGLTGTAM